jgi:wyosine [tRNA(Phe)-imidazoG37] synthetase (radical SAM superfamily)
MSPGYHSVVYGPIHSRRLGVSLGINPIPSPKGESCPAGCLYCATGTPDGEPRAGKTPSAGVVVTSAARRIIELSKSGEKLTSITVAGHGEPTMHPSFMEITENLRELRNKWYPKAELCLLSDSPAAGAPDLPRALRIYDKPILRFEWGSAKTFVSRTGGTAADFKARAELCASLERLVVQAVFDASNATDKEVGAWIKKMEEIHPREIQVLTVEPSSKKPRPLPDSKLEALAAKVSEKTGIPASAVTQEKQTAV